MLTKFNVEFETGRDSITTAHAWTCQHGGEGERWQERRGPEPGAGDSTFPETSTGTESYRYQDSRVGGREERARVSDSN